MTEKSKNYLDLLNNEQRIAVENVNGSILVLAGAGSGKTRVLTFKLLHLLIKKLATPNQIIAVTFTNKAASEMKQRISSMINFPIDKMWIGTFHSLCLRILKSNYEKLGLKSNFIIIDTEDQNKLMKQICDREKIDTKENSTKYFLSIIDGLKNKGISYDEINQSRLYKNDLEIKKIYKIYQEELIRLNCVDFGDLILYCIKLFKSNKNILENYQKLFKFILVDEYQDINFIQQKWLEYIYQGHKNICCVGDDDQSIYSWRGAEISNILRFEKDFPNAKTIRLEENYRSTGHILTAASKLIENNDSRLGKTLWTNSGEGEKITVKSNWDGEEEARQITSELEKLSLNNFNLDETAILVRASFQMREFEDRFIAVGLPYKVIGGPRFYERKEIRDVNAYLRLATQPNDSLALERIINTPKRGIGETSVKKIRDRSKENNLPLIESIKELIEEKSFKGKTAESLNKLVNLVFHWNQLIKEEDKVEIAEVIIEDSGYLEMLRNDKSLTAEGRVENVYELFRSLEPFESIKAYLEHISLVMEIDSNQHGKKVSLMTLHAAKGLEFDYVFLPGWEEGVFPNQRAIDEGGLEALEEERRLAYVGVTRAKKKASIYYSANRRMHNQWISSIPSRFVTELPEENIETDLSNYAGEKELFKEQEYIDFDQSDYETPGWERARFESKSKIIDNKTAENYIVKDSPFELNEKVTHKKFGKGKILSIDGKKLTISFGSNGTRKVMENFVEKI